VFRFVKGFYARLNREIKKEVLHGIVGRPRDDRYLIRVKKYSSSRYPKAIL